MECDEIETGVLNNGKPGHLPIFAIVKNLGYSKLDPENQDDEPKWRYFDEKKKEKFLDILENKLSHVNLNEQPEKILTDLTEATQSAIDECFPLKTKSRRAKKRSLTPWYDGEIYKDEKKQSRLFRKFIRSQNPEDHKVYTTFRKGLSKRKYKAKKAYFQELLTEAKNKEDRKATWDVINMAFGKKKKKRVLPEKVEIDDSTQPTTTECPQKIANVLNEHFTNIAKNLARNLEGTHHTPFDFMGKRNESSMFLTLIDLHEILDEVKSICVNKARGHDEIIPKVIKWAPDLFAPILHVLFNKCIEQGYYPSGMKVGEVAPVFKKGE